MRDLILSAFLLGSVPFILRRPAIGAFMWVWVSIMAPHRMTFGFAHDFPFAQIIAIATFIGMFVSKEPKRLPVTPVTVVLFLLVLWINVSTVFALDTDLAVPMWERVMKIQLMVFITLCVLYSKRHIQVLIWVVALSVGFYGIKGGLFTLRGGGELMVWGPEGSFIEDNNSLALATVMTIPVVYYLFQQTDKRWLRWGLFGAVLLCGFSVLGSYSRGAFLGIAAMMAFLWWNTRTKLVTALALALLIPVAIGFMPEKWGERMWSIQKYDQDESSLGRINAWMTAINLANDRPLVGGGFGIDNERVFSRYAPNPYDLHAAHSIYFQVLGEHGYVGLLLFLMLWFLVWRDAAWVMRHARSHGELRWAVDLARMIQVSLVGYAVGGAFQNQAYFDVPYNLLVALVLTRLLVEKAINDLEQNERAPVNPQVNAAPSGERGAAAAAPPRPADSPAGSVSLMEKESNRY
ncbi:MAG TPA: putative O-glycosylation ligase, exosortase A system-associated [Burkholderiales bacterium]|nr:putative O-glycosylation ligase, exosortase A system-associated [Burkholderiales bacterium]